MNALYGIDIYMYIILFPHNMHDSVKMGNNVYI